MPETKKTGKIILRCVDGQKAAGVCMFSTGNYGLEANVSAQLLSGGAASAVLQFGPDRDYRCRPPEIASEPLRCGEPGIMAVWVLDEGHPALFGQLAPGEFDRDAARARLPGSPGAQRERPGDVAVKAAALPAASEPAPPPREPFGEDAELPYRALAAQAGAKPPLHLLQSGEPEDVVFPLRAAERSAPEPVAPARQEAPRAQKAATQPWSPLIVRRAPRPAPRASVYTPLWDDISSELEKMLDTLPRTHPFNGGEIGAEFAEVPTGGAVQCYVGSVMINGLKVFLQAVPARPYARPAGFDHSLVSRGGECYWVKYYIQDS